MGVAGKVWGKQEECRGLGKWGVPCMVGREQSGPCAECGRLSVAMWGADLASDICVVSVWQNTLVRQKGLWVSKSSACQTLMCTQTTWGSCKNVDSVSRGPGGAQDSA